MAYLFIVQVIALERRIGVGTLCAILHNTALCNVHVSHILVPTGSNIDAKLSVPYSFSFCSVVLLMCVIRSILRLVSVNKYDSYLTE